MKNESPLDRDLQRKILVGLRELAPYGSDRIEEDLNLLDYERNKLITNLLYLEEHGLIRHGLERQDYVGGEPAYFQHQPAQITADGLDFLEADGGLSAILGVLTVRLHDDTIKTLIEAKILESDLSPADKQKFSARLRSLPADATKHLVMKLLDLGLEKSPAALGAIGTALGLAVGG